MCDHYKIVKNLIRTIYPYTLYCNNNYIISTETLEECRRIKQKMAANNGSMEVEIPDDFKDEDEE